MRNIKRLPRLHFGLKATRAFASEAISFGSAPHLLAIHVQFVEENLTFTGEDSPMSNLLLSLLGAVAEFERSTIRERQREGIALTKKAGVYKGRKPSLTGAQVAEIRKRVAAGEKKAALAAEFRVSRQTLYTALR